MVAQADADGRPVVHDAVPMAYGATWTAAQLEAARRNSTKPMLAPLSGDQLDHLVSLEQAGDKRAPEKDALLAHKASNVSGSFLSQWGKALICGGLVTTGCILALLWAMEQKEISEPKFPRLPERLIFSSEFQGAELDRSMWNVGRSMSGGGNDEFQFYTDDPANVFLKNDHLYIKPGLFADLPDITPNGRVDHTYTAEEVMTGQCEPWPDCANYLVERCTDDRFHGCNKTGNYPNGSVMNPATSGRLDTQGKFSFQYGRVEFHAKIPRGDWLWPALWLLPEEDTYGWWPGSGEIDVMESRGNDPSYVVKGKPGGRSAVGSTLHYGTMRHVVDHKKGNDSWLISDGWRHAHAEVEHKDAKNGMDFSQDFHTYGLLWDVDQLYTYIIYPDGTEHVQVDLRKGFSNGFWKPPLGDAGKPGWDNKYNPYDPNRVVGGGAPVTALDAAAPGRHHVPGLNAPFDRPFHLVMNVAIGGNAGGDFGYWNNPPWADCDPPQCSRLAKFWETKDQWLPTWQNAGDDSALQVDWVKVWQ